MDIRHFFAASRALIVAGKGGTGKSTVAAALATVATRAGMSVLHVSIDGRDSAPAAPGADRLGLSAGTALAEYLLGRGLGVVTRQLGRLGIVNLVASAAPGIDDLLVLGKIKQLVRDDPHDVIIVDGPAAGHALDLLRAPRSLKRTVPGGPVAHQADEVLAMLADPALARVMLVARPARTPVFELIETAREMTGVIGVGLSPVVMNAVHAGVPAGLSPRKGTPLRAAADYVAARHAAESSAMAMLGDAGLPGPLVAAHHASTGSELCALVADDLAAAIGGLG